MTRSLKCFRFAIAFAAVGACVSGAHASDFASSTPSLLGFTPKVPISALARPAGWFDPSRLQLSTSVTVGSGFGSGTQGLQVTSLSYAFRTPVWMRVNVGNAWGSATSANSSMFLEGVDLGVRPFTNFLIQVHYRDVRTPLQYGGYNSIFRPYGWGE